MYGRGGVYEALRGHRGVGAILNRGYFEQVGLF